MSKYTTELRFICESLANNDTSVDNTKVDNVIEVARQKIFDFDYPIFDIEYKPVLETKILRHYYFREIGCETYGLFKFHLQNKLNEIMPYYNKLYNSELLDFNPLYEVDLTRTKENTNEKTEQQTNEHSTQTTATSNITENNVIEDTTTPDITNTKAINTTNQDSTKKSNEHKEAATNQNTNLKLFQDTPQNNFGGNLDSGYLTDRTKVTDSGSNSSSGSYTDTITSTVTDLGSITDKRTGTEKVKTVEDKQKDTTNTNNTYNSGNKGLTANTTENYLEKIQGKTSSKSYSKLIQEYRQSFLNIDMSIIEELDELFFQLW